MLMLSGEICASFKVSHSVLVFGRYYLQLDQKFTCHWKISPIKLRLKLIRKMRESIIFFMLNDMGFFQSSALPVATSICLLLP